jgi:hypothetical protein
LSCLPTWQPPLSTGGFGMISSWGRRGGRSCCAGTRLGPGVDLLRL